MAKRCSYMTTTVYLRNKENGCECDYTTVSSVDKWIGKSRYRNSEILYLNALNADTIVDALNEKEIKELIISKKRFGYILTYSTKFAAKICPEFDLIECIRQHSFFINEIKKLYCFK